MRTRRRSSAIENPMACLVDIQRENYGMLSNALPFITAL